jgi:hypothetical protein
MKILEYMLPILNFLLSQASVEFKCICENGVDDSAKRKYKLELENLKVEKFMKIVYRKLMLFDDSFRLAFEIEYLLAFKLTNFQSFLKTFGSTSNSQQLIFGLFCLLTTETFTL